MERALREFPGFVEIFNVARIPGELSEPIYKISRIQEIRKRRVKFLEPELPCQGD